MTYSLLEAYTNKLNVHGIYTVHYICKIAFSRSDSYFSTILVEKEGPSDKKAER